MLLKISYETIELIAAVTRISVPGSKVDLLKSLVVKPPVVKFQCILVFLETEIPFYKAI